MRSFLEPTKLRRVALIILLGWFIPLTGVFGTTLFFSGIKDNNKNKLDNRLVLKTQGQDISGTVQNESITVEKDKDKDKQEEGKTKPKVHPSQNHLIADHAREQANIYGNSSIQSATKTRAGSIQNTNTNNKADSSVSKAESTNLNLLARVIHAEARGEPLTGQVAVGAVLLNRLESQRFPNNLWSIIFKKGEFCTVRDGQVWMRPNETAYKAARLALSGWDPTDGALYFYNPAKTTSKWIWSRPVTTKIGSHIFAR